ncbi:MAG: flagella cluster protein [Halobaculum sp.]
MERLDLSDGFDVHDHRSALKLLKQTGDSMQLANREEVACPACDRPFDRLFVTDRRTVSFDTAPNGPICLARTDDQLLLFTH